MTTTAHSDTAPRSTPYSAQSRIDSPLGALTLAATPRGLALVWFDDQQHRSASVDAPVDPQHPLLRQAARELRDYFDGGRGGFAVALDPQGTPFQQQVWLALRRIAHGQLSSYGAIARAVGRPDAARAVGAAVGRNPLGIVVPCHRVVGSNGALTGFAGGLHRKEALLVLEGLRSASLVEA